MKAAYKNILALSVISAIIAILMAITNYITAPIIKENEANAENEALLVVMPDGGDFEMLDLSCYTLPETVTDAYAASNGGYVVRLSTSGYASDMIILCGVAKDGSVTGAVCLSSGETLGYEKNYGDNFKGLTLEGVDSVDTISSATKTTSAYREAVRDAINTATILAGGSVDLRDEETVLRDNMTALLPASEGNFTRLFLVEALEGVTAVYTADNGAGAVYHFGDKMLALTASGEVLGEASDAEKATLSDYGARLAASKTELLSTDGLTLPKTVVKVEKTESGNYIFTVNANGFSMDHPDWGSPEPIVIRLAMTEAGVILDCDTVSHKESAGYGADCEKDAFTDQFIGKSDESYREIDGISGATVTTDAYLRGIKHAYDALTVLRGGESE